MWSRTQGHGLHACRQGHALAWAVIDQLTSSRPPGPFLASMRLRPSAVALRQL